MRKRKVAVFTNELNDFTTCLTGIDQLVIDTINFSEILEADLSSYDAFFILGSSKDIHEGVVFDPRTRNKLEKERRRGARFFCEFCKSFGYMYAGGLEDSKRQRMVSMLETSELDIPQGSLMDDYSSWYYPQAFLPVDGQLILARCGQPIAHNTIEVADPKEIKVADWALWIEEENIMFCSFPITSFVQARFAPFDYWKKIVEYIIEWACQLEVKVELKSIRRAYSFKLGTSDAFGSAENMINCGMNWFEKSGVILEGGKSGILEGLTAEILPNGDQKYSKSIRTDCMGETSLAYYLYGKLKNDSKALGISNNLEKFCFTEMFETVGVSTGMVRWTNEAWGVTYGDDAARFILGSLIKSKYTGERKYLSQIREALSYLVRTTGTDGLRAPRTDEYLLRSQQDIDDLAGKPGDYPSAHYNAYYHGALLMYGLVSGDRQFEEVATKGLHSIMNVYPKTLREHSETQELCRLVLPLALLFAAKPIEQHKKYLYQVCNDLQKFKNKNGAYLEWDTEYSAAFSHKGGTESSLLANNGDPICDLLYSINWLPLGFSAAYLATKDEWFIELWKELALFLSSIQIHSEDKKIDGAWARGIDVEKMEIFAMTNDVGWGPWAIETGWTMAEIISGLSVGLMEFRE